MGWEEKVKINELLIFCETWKSKDEIKNQFKLSHTESWHCVKFLGNLSHDMIVERRVGATKRAYRYKSRIGSFERAVEEEKLKEKIEPESAEIPTGLEDVSVEDFISQKDLDINEPKNQTPETQL